MSHRIAFVKLIRYLYSVIHYTLTNMYLIKLFISVYVYIYDYCDCAVYSVD